MDVIFQITAIAIVTVVCCCVIKPHSGAVSAGLTVLACVVIVLTAIALLRPVIAMLERMQSLSGLAGAVTAPMMKVAGISLLSQITSSICEDAGEKTLSNAVEIAAVIMSLYISLPLLTAVLDMIEEILTG